jgi:hypothetical protein
MKSTHGNKQNRKNKMTVEISTDIHLENRLKLGEKECGV